jgi:hypothetical protein
VVPVEQPTKPQAKQASHCHPVVLHHHLADYQGVPDYVARLALLGVSVRACWAFASVLV